MARITRYTPTRLTPPGPYESETDFGFMWPMTRLHQEMNRLFSDVFRGYEEGEKGEEGEEGRRSWTFNPVVDVDQQDNQYEITVELPGVRREDVNVEMTEDTLTISGSKERKETRGEGENRQSERVYGRFQRAFRLPDDTLRENIQARFSDGVLTVTVPRDESQRQSQARRIEVQSGPSEAIESQPAEQPAGAGEPEEQRPPATH